MTHEDIQSSLPALAAGRLPASESRRIESHVDGCRECEGILLDLRILAESIERRGECLFEEHPDPVLLERYAGGEAVPDEEALDSHLRLCASCSLQLAPVEVPSAAVERPWGPRLLRTLAASALVAAGVILGVSIRPGPERSSAAGEGPIDLPVIQRTARGQSPVTRIAVRPGQPVVVLAVPVDLGRVRSGTETLQLRVLRANGDAIYALRRPARWYRQTAAESGIVAVSIRSDRLPPGTYQIVLSGTGGPGDHRESLWFEIVREEPLVPQSGVAR